MPFVFLAAKSKCFAGLPSQTGQEAAARKLVETAPTVRLLQATDPTYRYNSGTVGPAFESFVAKLGQTYVSANTMLSMVGDAGFVGAPTAQYYVRSVLYYLEQGYESLTNTLSALDFTTVQSRFADLEQVVTAANTGLTAAQETAVAADLPERFAALLEVCLLAELKVIIAEYRNRLRAAEFLRYFAIYAKRCPGLQHKAGVPIGGTFILVYHEPRILNDALNPSPTRPRR